MANIVDYRSLMAELTKVLADMQASDIAVDEAVQKYERGQHLITELRTYLDQAENRITKRKSE